MIRYPCYHCQTCISDKIGQRSFFDSIKFFATQAKIPVMPQNKPPLRKSQTVLEELPTSSSASEESSSRSFIGHHSQPNYSHLTRQAATLRSNIDAIKESCEKLFYARNRELFRKHERQNSLVQLQTRVVTAVRQVEQLRSDSEEAVRASEEERSLTKQLEGLQTALESLRGRVEAVTQRDDLTGMDSAVIGCGEIQTLTEEVCELIERWGGEEVGRRGRDLLFGGGRRGRDLLFGGGRRGRDLLFGVQSAHHCPIS